MFHHENRPVGGNSGPNNRTNATVAVMTFRSKGQGQPVVETAPSSLSVQS